MKPSEERRRIRAVMIFLGVIAAYFLWHIVFNNNVSERTDLWKKGREKINLSLLPSKNLDKWWDRKLEKLSQVAQP